MLTTTTNKGFKLTIGSVTASSLGTISTQVGSNVYTIKLHNITFNRQLYKPNSIVADIQFMTAPLSSDYETLVGKAVTLERLVKAESGPSAPTTDETFNGFYVHEILPLRSANQNLYLRLHIFSLDHQITLQKYSRTYVAKKLFEDIICGIDSTKDIPQYTDAKFAYNTSPAKLTHSFQTYYKKDATDDVYTTFDHLKASISYNKDESSTATTSKTEMIQPYLVQYNESFYDFMARTANRCGEFLFWEENALHLGRTCVDTDLASSISDSECLSVYYNTIDTSTTLDTKSLKFDDLNDFSDGKVRELNHSKQGDDFATATDFCVNPAVRHDNYITRVYKDRFSSTANEKFSNLPKYFLGLVSKAFNEVSLYDIMKKLLLLEPFSFITARSISDGTNNYNNEINITNDKRSHKEQRTSKNTSGDVYYSLFTTADSNGHPTATFYDTIRTNEERQTRQIVTFNLADTKKLRLGQQITYDSKKYYVIQIKERPTTAESKFSKIDAEAEKEFQDLDGGIMQVRAIPETSDSKVYPPLLPSGHVRTSEPQVAFVAEYLDPEKRGRVRILYPWQKQTDDAEPSPWIRVLTPSATPESGCVFELAENDEVLVNYESNNIERPYVAGALYNRRNAIPFRRGDLAIVSKNGHAIAFDDPVDASKFAEGILPFYGFIKSIIHPIKPNGELSALKLTGGITLSDAYGFYKIAMSTDQRKIDISSPFGNVNIDAFTGINILAPNGDINIKGQNINIEAGNAVKITSGVNIKKKGFMYKFADTETPEQQAAQVAAVVTDSIADYIKPLATIADLNLLRKIVEVIVRPIDGTLQIKSHQYLMLEAGPGEASVQPDRYSIHNDDEYNDTQKSMRKSAALIGAIDLIQIINEDLFKNIEETRTKMLRALKTYNEKRQKIAGTYVDRSCIKGGKITEAVYNNGHAPEIIEFEKDSDELKVLEGRPDDDTELDDMITAANELAEESYDFYSLTYSPETHVEIKLRHLTKGKIKSSAPETLLYPNIYSAYCDALSDMENEMKNSNLEWDIYNPSTPAHKKLFKQIKDSVRKSCFVSLIMNNEPGFKFSDTLTINKDTTWDEIVENLEKIKIEKPSFNPFVDAFKSIAMPYLAFKEIKDRDHWKSGKPGQIIFSDQPHQSYYFDNHGATKRYANGTALEDTSLDSIKQKLSSWISEPIPSSTTTTTTTQKK